MSDVPPGDEAPAGNPAEPYVPSGRRRSTFTPPGSDSDEQAESDATVDDDALADMLAAQTAMYTTPITLPNAESLAQQAAERPAAEPEPQLEPEPEPQPEPETLPETEAASPEPVPPAFPAFAYEQPTPPVEPEPEPVEPEATEPEAYEPEAVEPAPYEPEPFQPEAVEPEPLQPEAFQPEPFYPEPFYPEPVRSDPFEAESVEFESFEPEQAAPDADFAADTDAESRKPLSDDELMRSLSETAESGSTLAAIERLEEELRLREQAAVAEPQTFSPEPFVAEPPIAEPYIAQPFVPEPAPIEPVAEPPAVALPEPWPMEPPPANWAPPAEDEIPAAFDAPVQPTFPPDEHDLPPDLAAPVPQPEELDAEQPWNLPPVVLVPPALVEPPLAPPPITSVDVGDGRVDVSELPPPIGVEPVEPAPVDPALLAPPDDEQPFTSYDAPPPVATPPADPAPPAEPWFDQDAATAAAASAAGAVTFDAMLAGARPEPSSLDREESDVIDDVDRVFPAAIAVNTEGIAIQVAPPSGPIATQRLSQDEVAMIAPEPASPPAFEVEVHGLEPTVLDQRAGRSARLFWLWFAANASILSVALGAIQFSLGMSLRQAIVATLAGVALSFLPLGLGTLAGKWSGQPTMVVSRASFGVVGNVVPAALAVLSRVFWGGVMIWLLAASVSRVLVGAGADLGFGETVWSLIGLAAGVVIAALVAFFGYGLLARVQLVLSILTAILVIGAAVLTYQYLDFAEALTTGDGSWVLVISGTVLVFSVIGLTWVHSSSDLARYQRPGSSGASSMLWATFGATLPPFLLISWGAMLAASSDALAEGLATQPLVTLASLLPAWYPIPLLLAAGLSLVSGAVLAMYSGGFALQAVGLRVPRALAVLVTALLVTGVAGVLLYLGTDARELMRDIVTTLAVPIAAWAGIFAAEMMIRSRRFHAPSLLSRGGVYPDFRWANFVGLFAISAVSFGLTSATLTGLEWQGFLFPVFGIAAEDPLATSDVGVLVALLLGLVVPLVSAIPEIRRQEDAKPPEE